MENKGNETQRSECEVCEMLIREKHRNDYVWKVLCVCFLGVALILAILYFGAGKFKTETRYKFEDSLGDNEIQGDSNVVIGNDNTTIDSNGAVTNGTSEKTDYTPLICVSIIFGALVIVVGGIIIANHNNKQG